jgi:hypothetical protein
MPSSPSPSGVPIENRFSRGPEGWCSYDYHASMVSGRTNIFILGTWAKGGGVGDGNYIWTDHTRWSADTPEKPLSILPLLFYRSWIDADPVDLREREVSVSLRGDDLNLDGARCFFWVHGGNTRWHYTARPLEISAGRWGPELQRFVLRDDPARWHRSWSLDEPTALSLSQTLQEARSYGFSFTGFSSEVTGRLALGAFAIAARK